MHMDIFGQQFNSNCKGICVYMYMPVYGLEEEIWKRRDLTGSLIRMGTSTIPTLPKRKRELNFKDVNWEPRNTISTRLLLIKI